MSAAPLRGIVRSRTWAPLVVALGAIASLGCKKQAPPPAPARVTPAVPTSIESVRPAPRAAPTKPPLKSVVLITVDALRADQPWSGYEAAKTPRLNALVKESVFYPRAYSLANTTTPSLNALLAARYPTELVRDNCPLAGFTVEDGLARTLAAAGVTTLASHGHSIFASSFAPKDGFGEWKVTNDVGRVTDGAVTGEGVANQLIELIELGRTTGEGRFFAWAHFVDPHDAYVAHEAFPKSANPSRGLYDGEVAYTDFQIGRVLDALEDKGLLETTALILTADHGEAFNEHATYRHGYSVYEEEIRVPLVLRVPGAKPQIIAQPRSAIDLARTIAELLAVKAPAAWRGTSLLRDLERHGPAQARDVLVDTPDLITGIARRAFIRGNKKLITEARKDKLFDLEADPKEERAATGPEIAVFRDEARAVWKTLAEVPSTYCTREAFKAGSQ